MAGRVDLQEVGVVHRRTLRVAGSLLVAGGLLWQPLLALEHLAGLEQRSATFPWYSDQVGFLLAMVALLLGIVGLDRARVAGDGRVGRLAMRGLVLAWGVLVVGQVVTLGTGLDAGVLLAVGGLLSYPTALIAGIATVRAGRLTRWRRWPLLAMALYETTAILIPLLLVDGSGPSWLAEAVWQLAWVLVGASALSQARVSSDLPVTQRTAAIMLNP